ncbi:dipeptidyl-peptidase 3 family protein [Perlabentimonas gracilis]|uniref:dipeptidyl-peptidase 3 family protein n=1 Tax=Perlabentimonas gracilis TaxID=2715279 RepID=UPI001407983D|nr:Zn-dependent hydrolase [Perlabentimonas gracilis]NHB69914.1 Zn-dependent hydrolase [Perlabentimonas gracilis]
MKKTTLLILVAMIVAGTSCDKKLKSNADMQAKVNAFIEVELTTDISHLSENEKEMLPLLFEAAQIMDDIFWTQAYGDKEKLLSRIDDDTTKAFVNLNYGPWERLNNNAPFIVGYGEKPMGANFYPADMTQEEFEAFDADNKTSLYTIIRRKADGSLESIPYSQAYKKQHEKAAKLLRQAAELAEYENLKNYLNLRAEALLSDDYLASDMAWMDMKDNNIDFIVGPIENYEDRLFNYKAAHEAFILIKDLEWSQKLSRFAALLPALQRNLPVANKYKAEVPGSDSDLGVYDAVFYAGDCNAGSKTIAINLPNDPIVHIEKGSRKLQLKNSMRYKFDEILVPISKIVIDEEQRKHVTFDAFFENTMFHEVAHGLGIKNTINNNGTVREALRETYSPIEENKADILGLFMVSNLVAMGEMGEKDLMDNYVTFMAGIFRSVRFGAASAHGKANMMRFYYFQEQGAFTRNPETGTYKVDFEMMTKAMNSLAEKILVVQGDGNYQEAKKMLDEMGYIKEELQADLNRINESNIPVDIRFKQGLEMLGL